MEKSWFIWHVVIFSTIVAADYSNNKIAESTRKICTSHDCLIKNMEYALDMLRNMNTSVDPCDNFYEFACGNFEDPNSSTPKRSKYFDKANDDMAEKMKRLITDSHRSFKIKPFKFISDFYYSCENTNNYHKYIDEDNTDYLNELILKSGGWPVLEGDKWNETIFNREFYGLGINVRDNVKFSLIPLVSNLKTERSKEELFNASLDFMSNVAIFLGADKDQVKELELAAKFEHDTRKIHNDIKEVDKNNSTPVKMSVKEMIDKWPSIDWIKFLNSDVRSYYNFTNETNIYVHNPNFTTHFEKLLNDTPKRVQANYVVWKLIWDAIPYIHSKTLLNYYRNYIKFISPSHLPEEDQFHCYELVQRFLGILLHVYYIHENPVDKRTKSEANAMFSYVKNKLIEVVNQSKWLDSNAQNEMIDTIISLEMIIGYPDELMNDDDLKKYFEGLEITRNNFYKNVQSASSFNVEKKLFSTFNKTRSGMDLFIYIFDKPNNAFYDKFNGLTSVSVELLQNNFFDVDRFNYLNYGTLGQIIGHELAHVVDSTDGRTSKSGLPSNWGNSSKDEYQKREFCINNQFNNYFGQKNETKFNATRYLRENIADNIGINIAYLAYQDWVAEHGNEPNLLGMSYTPNQLFWISYANNWCQSKSLLGQSPNDVHAPTNLRVIGSLSNSIDFSNDFKCPVGSKMNPSKKCIFF